MFKGNVPGNPQAKGFATLFAAAAGEVATFVETSHSWCLKGSVSRASFRRTGVKTLPNLARSTNSANRRGDRKSTRSIRNSSVC
jgi:hypothetical protein